jgi:hypothetical protein
MTFSAILLARLAPAVRAGDTPITERQKIEALISRIERLDGAVFIRNDTEYSARTAGWFLREKWRSKEVEVETATDFIQKVASISSTTGRPYLIRFRDGTQQKKRRFSPRGTEEDGRSEISG